MDSAAADCIFRSFVYFPLFEKLIMEIEKKTIIVRNFKVYFDRRMIKILFFGN